MTPTNTSKMAHTKTSPFKSVVNPRKNLFKLYISFSLNQSRFKCPHLSHLCIKI